MGVTGVSILGGLVALIAARGWRLRAAAFLAASVIIFVAAAWLAFTLELQHDCSCIDPIRPSDNARRAPHCVTPTRRPAAGERHG